jgi:hypothetical protein
VTLIAFRIEEDYAEILTDTLTYGLGEAEFCQTSKVRLFPHVDAAMMARGASELGAYWLAILDSDPPGAQSFDAWGATAQRRLPELWAMMRDKEGTRDVGEIFHVGWSESRGRFVGSELNSTNGFQSRDLTEQGFFSAPDLTEPPEPPSSVEEWVSFAERVYDECSLASYMTKRKCFIGGDLILTRLERGHAVQRRVHSFPVDDWKYRQMMIGSLHPLGQLGPCICGQGQPYALCCLRGMEPTAPCPCKNGRTFGDCHQIDVFSPEHQMQAVTHWAHHREDFVRTRDELAAAFQAAFPDMQLEPPIAVIPHL